MKTRFLSGLALAALPLLLGTGAHAQAARTIYLYNSSLGTAPGVATDAQTGSWGNGSAFRSRRVQYEGAPTLQVTTRNFAEGLRFDLAQPLDPMPYTANGFIRLRIKFNEIGGGAGAGAGFPGGGAFGGGGGFPGGGGRGGRGGFRGGGGGGFPGGGGAFGGGGFPGGGAGAPGGAPDTGTLFQIRPPSTGTTQWQGSAQFAPRGGGGGALPGMGGPGGFPGGLPGGVPGGFPGGAGPDGAGAAQGPLPQATYIKEFKITFLRETGITTGRFKVDLNANKPDDSGWHLFTLALKDMTSTPGASGAITRMLLTSDAQDTFSLAQVALVVETGEMTVSLRTPDRPVGTQMAEVTWKPSQPLLLIADVEAGAADAQVEWNFDADNVGLPRADAATGAGGFPGGAPGGGAFGGATLGGGGLPGGGVPGGGAMGAPQGVPGGAGGARFPGAPGAPGGGEGGFGTPVPLGPRIDARGLTTSFTFPNEEQDYRVEVTVRDRSGKKQPVKASILVHIRG